MVWSPSFTVSRSWHSNHARASLSTGRPLGLRLNSASPNWLPSGSTCLKKALASGTWPVSSTLMLNRPLLSIIAVEGLSALAPSTTRGGANDAWVSQLTAAPVIVLSSFTVITNRPYGIMRRAVFFAASSMVVLLSSSQHRVPPPRRRGGAREWGSLLY